MGYNLIRDQNIKNPIIKLASLATCFSEAVIEDNFCRCRNDYFLGGNILHFSKVVMS